MATRLDQQIEQLENIVEMVLRPAQNNVDKNELHITGKSQTERLYQTAKAIHSPVIGNAEVMGVHSLRDCCGEFVSLIATTYF